MNLNYPGELSAAVARLVDVARDLRDAAQSLTAAYRNGKDSSHINLVAYLATRVPATYAANRRVMSELQRLRPDFAPQAVLDVGAGPGTASWAALAQWPNVSHVSQVEKSTPFMALAKALNGQSEVPALMAAEVVSGNVLKLPLGHKADLVIASYVLAELPMAEISAAVDNLWRCAGDVLILIEPGTPAGFDRLRLVRSRLLGAGGQVVAPCTHHFVCPMERDDWCHFKVRVQRSRAHMKAKNAAVPFEDEAYSYLVIQREKLVVSGDRVLSPPSISKVAVSLRLCTDQGVATPQIASRDKPAYKRAKKIGWGDLWE